MHPPCAGTCFCTHILAEFASVLMFVSASFPYMAALSFMRQRRLHSHSRSCEDLLIVAALYHLSSSHLSAICTCERCTHLLVFVAVLVIESSSCILIGLSVKQLARKRRRGATGDEVGRMRRGSEPARISLQRTRGQRRGAGPYDVDEEGREA